MNSKTEIRRILSVPLSQGQGDFPTKSWLSLSREVHNLLVQGQLGMLVLEGQLNLSIEDGTVLYAAANARDEPGEALPLESLIETVRGTEGKQESSRSIGAGRLDSGASLIS